MAACVKDAKWQRMDTTVFDVFDYFFFVHLKYRTQKWTFFYIFRINGNFDIQMRVVTMKQIHASYSQYKQQQKNNDETKYALKFQLTQI